MLWVSYVTIAKRMSLRNKEMFFPLEHALCISAAAKEGTAISELRNN